MEVGIVAVLESGLFNITGSVYAMVVKEEALKLALATLDSESQLPAAFLLLPLCVFLFCGFRRAYRASASEGYEVLEWSMKGHLQSVLSRGGGNTISTRSSAAQPSPPQ